MASRVRVLMLLRNFVLELEGHLASQAPACGHVYMFTFSRREYSLHESLTIASFFFYNLLSSHLFNLTSRRAAREKLFRRTEHSRQSLR